MSAVATREALAHHGDVAAAEPSAPQLFEPHGPTLEERIVAAWDELTVAGRVTCPVCSGEMTRAGGCEGCGAELR